MNDIKYPERIERMLDVMVCLPKSAWGWVLLDVEKKIGMAALQRIISRAYQIEKANMHGKGKSKGERKRKRRSAKNAPKIVASIPPTALGHQAINYQSSAILSAGWGGITRS